MHNTVTMMSSISFDPKMYKVKARPLNKMWNRQAVGCEDWVNWSADGRASYDGLYDDDGAAPAAAAGEVEGLADDDIMLDSTLFV